MEGTSSISNFNVYPFRVKLIYSFAEILLGVSSLAEYFFDMETTGFNFDIDEIITIQWQRLHGFTGEPIGELNILKRWDSSEKEILETFLPNLRCKPFDFILIGKNILFDFCLLNQRMKQHNLGGLDLRWLCKRVSIDTTPILVMINKGNFRDYDKVLPKTNPLTNEMIPQFYKEGKYEEITQYIKDEANDFIKAYQILKREMPKLKNLIAFTNTVRNPKRSI